MPSQDVQVALAIPIVVDRFQIILKKSSRLTPLRRPPKTLAADLTLALGVETSTI
jgi:hypothetical protein